MHSPGALILPETPSTTILCAPHPQLLLVAAPLDLLPALWKRQHDAARLPPDDLLTPVGERDADEDPVWAWGPSGTLVEDHATLPGL